MVVRLLDKASGHWTVSPHGLACVTIGAFAWPLHATCGADLGHITCDLRTRGGIATYDIKRVTLPVQALVFSSDWILSSMALDTTVRGSPVPEGSPLGEVLKTPTMLLSAGSSLDAVATNPERYLKGKEKISVLVIGFYCARKATKHDAAVYHVSRISYQQTNVEHRPCFSRAGRRIPLWKERIGWRTLTPLLSQSWIQFSKSDHSPSIFTRK